MGYIMVDRQLGIIPGDGGRREKGSVRIRVERE